MIGQNIAILSSHWLQAYFEKMKLPFTGSGAEETRFGLNKVQLNICSQQMCR